jgi:hypothetical protein
VLSGLERFVACAPWTRKIVTLAIAGCLAYFLP